MVSFELKVILHVAENYSKYRDVAPLLTRVKLRDSGNLYRSNQFVNARHLRDFCLTQTLRDYK